MKWVCGALDKATVGKRELWMHCGLARNHDGNHFDAKRKYSWSGPAIYWDEFDRNGKERRRKERVTIELETKSESGLFRHFGGQNIKLLSAFDRAEREIWRRDVDAFAEWYAEEHKRLQDEMFEPYCGEF